jgi:hypothetical protein
MGNIPPVPQRVWYSDFSSFFIPQKIGFEKEIKNAKKLGRGNLFSSLKE